MEENFWITVKKESVECLLVLKQLFVSSTEKYVFFSGAYKIFEN